MFSGAVPGCQWRLEIQGSSKDFLPTLQNLPLGVLAETGALGFAALFVWAGIAFRRLGYSIAGEEPRSLLALGLLASLASYAVASLTIWFVYQFLLLWLLLAVALAFPSSVIPPTGFRIRSNNST